MTMEELLSELHDLHLPMTATEGGGPIFAKGPFLILAMLLIGLFAYSRWRRGRWVRWARVRLRGLEKAADTALKASASTEAAWLHLVSFTAEVARQTKAGTPPAFVFIPPAQVEQSDQDALLTYLRTALRTYR